MIELFTSETPNGWKISVTLEEMGLDYKVRHVKLSEQQQKADWYLKLNPNGRIPTIIDHDNDDFVVFESGAIMVYLAEKTGFLMPSDIKGRSLVLQWLFFQNAGVGPMMGQLNVFNRYAPEKIPYAIDRYMRESRRLLDILDTRLADNEFLAGDYSIADIANWSWAQGWDYCQVDITGLDNLKRWLDQIGSRPAVQRGRAVPAPTDLGTGGEDSTEAGKKFLV